MINTNITIKIDQNNLFNGIVRINIGHHQSTCNYIYVHTRAGRYIIILPWYKLDTLYVIFTWFHHQYFIITMIIPSWYCHVFTGLESLVWFTIFMVSKRVINDSCKLVVKHVFWLLVLVVPSRSLQKRRQFLQYGPTLDSKPTMMVSKDNAICRLCEMPVPSKGGSTSNMFSHFKCRLGCWLVKAKSNPQD